jgi:T4-like virus tail tube protein gp19
MHRWAFQTIGNFFSQLELLVLKTASRPQFKFDEALMEHNQETGYFAGKQKWEPIELTWYDIEQSPDVSAAIYKWLQSVSDINTANVALPSSYKKNASLAMLSGQGAPTESWTIYGVWPQAVDWKGLDYGSSEIATIGAKMRYDRAVRS